MQITGARRILIVSSLLVLLLAGSALADPRERFAQETGLDLDLIGVAQVEIDGIELTLTFVFINFFPAMGLITPIAEPAVKQLALIPYLFIWGLFTFWMFLGTMKTNRVLQFVFLSLAILFWLLALGHFAYWNSWNATGVADPLINIIAGYEGIICGFSAIYLAMAEVLNEVYGKDVMPIGRIK